MPDVNAAARPLAPRVTALQSAWLREIGVPRGFAAPTPAAPPSAPLQAVQPAAARPTAVTTPERVEVAESTQASAGRRESTVLPPSAAAKAATLATPVRAQSSERDLQALQTASFDELREHVAQCGVCNLCHTRAHAVFGAGTQGAEWMIVGEAPGEQEDAQALPFVGKSGQLLTQMLQAVGVDRERDVFITNIVKCRPPGNRNPKVEEIEACKPYLLRQIDLVAPRRLLVLGRFAAQVLLGSDASLASLRGRLHTFTDSAQREIPLVVSYHPAYLLRSPFEKARTWQDLHLAMSARRLDD